MRFSQLVPWKHESVGWVLPEPQLGKPRDVRWIISTQKGSFVFVVPNFKYPVDYNTIVKISTV